MLGGHFQVVFLKVLGAVSTTVDPLHTLSNFRHLQGACPDNIRGSTHCYRLHVYTGSRVYNVGTFKEPVLILYPRP